MTVNDSVIYKGFDSLHVTANQLLVANQAASSKLDMLNEALLHQDSLQCVQTIRLDSLSEQLNVITNYGAGFSDAASHIAIPLIVALYAFAFTFLITVITNIKKEYNSKEISELFSSESSYKWFIWGSGISVGAIIVMGLLSLVLKDIWHSHFSYVLNYVSLFVAGLYAAIIMWFALVCIRYSNPRRIVGLIEDRYQAGRRRADASVRKLEKKKRKNNKEKSETKRATELHLSKTLVYYNLEEARVKRLADFGKYTLGKQDYDLFLSVIIKIDSLAKEGKKNADSPDEHWIVLFYEDIVKAYLFCPQNSKVEDTLMMYWFSAFNHSQEPNPVTIYNILGLMVKAVQAGRVSLFESYMLKSQYGYNFINRLQIVSYVRGGSEEEQKRVNASRLDFWAELCEMHYITLAYLFATGYSKAVRVVLSGQNMGYDKMLPSDGAEILKMYARCKVKKPDNSRYCKYWYLKDVIGENTDPDMLEKLTALLLLVASSFSSERMNLISPSMLKIIIDARDKLVNYGIMWSATYKSVFPQMGNNKIDELFDKYFTRLEEGAKIEGKVNDHNLLVRWFYAFLMFLLCKEEIKQEIYDLPLSKKMKENVKVLFWNILYGNKGYIEDGLAGADSVEKTEHELMGSMTFMANKHVLMNADGIHSGHDFNNMLNIFRSRYLYIVYQTLLKMNAKEKTIRMEEFHMAFTEYVGDDAPEYLIMDNDASITSFFNLDKANDGRKFTFNRTYQGADYHHFDHNIGWYLNDVAGLGGFEGTIIVVKKSDMPAIVALANTDGPDVTFKDESDKEKGIAAVSLTVNPNYEIRYCKKVNFLLLRVNRRQK